MTEGLSDEELTAYFALRGAGDRLQRAVTRHLRASGLTEVQFTILARLGAGRSGVGMSELARALVVTKSGLTYQAGRLERRGLVARGTSADDDRAVLLRLTPEGAALLAKVLPAHVALVRELFLDRLDPADLATVRDALARVARDERHEGTARGPLPRSGAGRRGRRPVVPTTLVARPSAPAGPWAACPENPPRPRGRK